MIIMFSYISQTNAFNLFMVFNAILNIFECDNAINYV